MNLVKILLILLIPLCLSFIIPIDKSIAQEQEIIIQTLPQKELFDCQNMAPGDSETRKITVQNTGKDDFHYKTTFLLKSGSKKLFNELLLNITKDETTLFNGRMKDFEKLDSRLLKGKTQEDLTLKVKVPEKLGNDYQGLFLSVEMTFTAEGIPASFLETGSKFPNTGTNMFNILLTGVTLLVTGLILQLYLILRKNKLSV